MYTRKQRLQLCVLCGVHHNFVRDIDIVKRGWACTPPPPSTGWADFSIVMECALESGHCHDMCTLLFYVCLLFFNNENSQLGCLRISENTNLPNKMPLSIPDVKEYKCQHNSFLSFLFPAQNLLSWKNILGSSKVTILLQTVCNWMDSEKSPPLPSIGETLHKRPPQIENFCQLTQLPLSKRVAMLKCTGCCLWRGTSVSRALRFYIN